MTNKRRILEDAIQTTAEQMKFYEECANKLGRRKLEYRLNISHEIK